MMDLRLLHDGACEDRGDIYYYYPSCSPHPLCNTEIKKYITENEVMASQAALTKHVDKLEKDT